MSTENTERILAELAAARFAPPGSAYAAHRAGIYPAFQDFVEITSRHIADPRILAELELMGQKLQKETVERGQHERQN
ncbi:hypothetical protein NO2_0042 [Candidatus Termititenax persephonae]|uniref:Uncharacterized protein n=1 Tax=Candidatus Termititenax persephonae TaxID=2218525 RepID=A0A388TFE6_9BACT|nr:hypothetical protein NO2_0042 [Candidatus Termititenax persephonae]